MDRTQLQPDLGLTAVDQSWLPYLPTKGSQCSKAERIVGCMEAGESVTSGCRWGVSMTPPGGQGGDPKMQDIIRSQQLR